MFGRSKAELRADLQRMSQNYWDLKAEVEKAKPKGTCLRCAKLTPYVGEGNEYFCQTCETRVQYGKEAGDVWSYSGPHH